MNSGTSTEIDTEGGRLCRAYAVIAAEMQAANVPDDAYMIGRDAGPGTRSRFPMENLLSSLKRSSTGSSGRSAALARGRGEPVLHVIISNEPATAGLRRDQRAAFGSPARGLI
jgi:hypothetical protein